MFLSEMIKLRYPFAKRYPLGPLTFGAYPNWLKRIWGKPHNGIDIVAPAHAPILAAHDGTVVFSGIDSSGSNTIIIRQGIWETFYAHLRTISVGKGAKVRVGQRIGAVGQTGVATGPHLHFSLRKVVSWKPYRVKYLDPKPYFYPVKPAPPLTPAPKPVPKGDQFFTVKKGGWRSDVIQEIINAGFWKGSWRDHLAVFNALNPVTPRGGWKPGDKVGIMKPELKPPPKPKEVIRTCNKCGHKHKCRR